MEFSREEDCVNFQGRDRQQVDLLRLVQDIKIYWVVLEMCRESYQNLTRNSKNKQTKYSYSNYFLFSWMAYSNPLHHKSYNSFIHQVYHRHVDDRVLLFFIFLYFFGLSYAYIKCNNLSYIIKNQTKHINLINELVYKQEWNIFRTMIAPFLKTRLPIFLSI